MPRRPVNAPYTITTEFGVPDSYAKFGRHSGVDYAGFGAGRPVYAPASGTLTNIVSPTGGNMVQIFDGRYYHRLMHNSSFSRGNGKVNEGDQVATAGTTGLSTGVHAHWDIADRAVPTAFSQFINPNQYLTQSPQGGGMLMVDKNLLINYYQVLLGRQPDAGAYPTWIGKPADVVFQNLKDSAERQSYVAAQANRVKQLEASEQNLAKAVRDRDNVIASIQDKVALSDSLQKKVDALQTEQAQDQATGNAILRFIGKLFRKGDV